MYEKVFHFSSRPFTSTPFVKHYFSGDSIHQALGQARICIDRASGPVMAIGGAGTGKSLLLAMLEDQYQSQFNVVNLACGKLENRQDLLQSILFELKQPYQGMTDAELRFALIDYLSPSEQCPNGILLLIDEAQFLPQEMLDEVRLITNFVRDGQPRVRLVMAGNHRLEENLAEPKLESFNQRIAARCYLSNMSRDETAQYVVEHIDQAGGEGRSLFDDASLKAVYEVSEGCPRLVNQVCDHALILAATRGELVISDQCVLEAWSDIQSIPGDWAAPATQPESVSKIQDDESWTIIEFGQLEESDQQPDDGTVYDFENPQSQTAAGDIEDGDAEDSWEASGQSEAPESELPSAAIASDWNQTELMALQSNEWTSTEFDEPGQAQADADEYAETTMEVNETEESLENSLAEFTAGSDSPGSDSPQGNSEAAEDTESEAEYHPEEAVDFVANSTDDMEAELNAVFGKEFAPTDFRDEREIADLEAEQQALLDEMESATGEGHSAEFDPMASEQLAAAISRFTPENSEFHSADSSSDETVHEDETDDETALSDRPATEFASDTDCEIAPDFQVEERSEPQTHAEEHHETQLESQFAAQVPTMENADPVVDLSPDPQEPLESYEPEPVGETDDPFAEEFAEEEHLIDRYAPFVALQNQSSLTVTSSDLEMIRPRDAEVEAEVEAEEVIAFDSSATENVDYVEPVASSMSEESEAILEASDTFEEAVNTDPSDPVEESESAEVSPAFDAAAIEDEESPVTAPGVYIIEAEQSEDVKNPLAELDHAAESAESDLSSADYESALNAASQFSAASMAQPEIEPADSEPTLHTSEAEPSSAEIEQQAEEILKRLGISQNVSCETEPSDSVNIDSEDLPSHQDHVVVPRATVATVPLVTIPEPIMPTQLANESAETSEFDRQNAAIDETQQILNEILAQKNLLANQQHVESDIDKHSTSTIEPSDPPESLEIENPASDDFAACQDEAPSDDREMIIVNKMDEKSDSTESKEEPISFPSTPISKGRAERMDYQKLFDQLRDISNS